VHVDAMGDSSFPTFSLLLRSRPFGPARQDDVSKRRLVRRLSKITL